MIACEEQVNHNECGLASYQKFRSDGWCGERKRLREERRVLVTGSEGWKRKTDLPTQEEL